VSDQGDQSRTEARRLRIKEANSERAVRDMLRLVKPGRLITSREIEDERVTKLLDKEESWIL
jgi:hypothetical protein